MSEGNVESVRAVYEGWGKGDFRAGLDHFAPDLVFVMGPGFPEAGEYEGIDGIKRYTRGFLEAWTDIAIEAEEIHDAGDMVLAEVRQHGVGDGSGAATEFRYFQVWTFRDGKAIRLENVRERAAALEAAGLTPG
jgi:ketosteroid isomerase-like protein